MDEKKKDNDGGDDGEKLFTQKQMNDLVGKARVKAREKAESDAKTKADADKATAEQASMVAKQEWKALADQRQARIAELEPLEAQVKAYEGLIAGMLKDRVKELGETAQKAVGALPESMSPVERLAWLETNIDLFPATGAEVGTPARKSKKQADQSIDSGPKYDMHDTPRI